MHVREEAAPSVLSGARRGATGVGAKLCEAFWFCADRRFPWPTRAGTALRSLHLREVSLEGNHDWAQMSSLTALSSLTLSAVRNTLKDGPHGRLVQDSMPALLPSMRCLEQLALTDARADALAHLSCSLTQLCITIRNYDAGTFQPEHISRHTALQTLAWTGGTPAMRRQIASLPNIPNVICY